MRAVMLTTQELVGGENLSLWRRGFSVPFQGVLGALGTQRRGIKGMILRYISPQCLERSQSLTQASYVHWIINEGVSEGRDFSISRWVLWIKLGNLAVVAEGAHGIWNALPCEGSLSRTKNFPVSTLQSS
jgi:hypothetical protein